MTKNQLNEDDPKLKLIDARLEKIREEIKQACASCGRSPEEITVMAVTKTVAPVYINYAVKKGGLTILGENRAQELCEKYDDYLLKREHIHFIGHLQTNKVRQIIDKVSMIQSVDSLKLAKEIDLQAEKHHLSMDVLLEVNIGREETKSGVLPENLPDLLVSVSGLENIRIRGLMAIPPQNQAEHYFSEMEELFQKQKKEQKWDVLSLGMSADYPLAVRHGSTMVRLGSAIFGPRNYV